MELFMNLGNAVTVVGAGVTVYNGYRLLTAEGPDAQRQRRTALICMAVGIAILSVGLALNEPMSFVKDEGNSSLTKLAENFTKPEANFTKANVTEAIKFANVEANCPIAAPFAKYMPKAEAICPTSCPTAALNDVMQSENIHFVMSRSFKALNKTLGISCENYLGWKPEFADRIQMADMHKPVMWGFTGKGNPFLAIKTTCEQVKSLSRIDVSGDDITLLLQNGHPSNKHAFYGAPCLPNLARAMNFFFGLKKPYEIPEMLNTLFKNQTFTSSDVLKNSITKLTLVNS